MNRQATNLRFETLWRRTTDQTNGQAVRQIETAAEIGRALFGKYAEPGRHYHTIDHIDCCLEMFDQVRDQCANPDAVELAIWFHDAIYNFPVDNNERLSAEYFMRESLGVLPETLRELVFDQIIVTDHRSPPSNNDQRLLIDIDLSSFGRPWERFIKDGENVRLEMNYLDDSEFYPGQIAFMNQLLSRSRFYTTDWFQKHFESTARNNVRRYLRTLDERGYAVT